ncbi:hypothetical protein C8Q77DRAFT_393286 [Trametes polyzona]|nr:hypothetical protein C8Q77DRAFT_393286 [Trametes polyzona]
MGQHGGSNGRAGGGRNAHTGCMMAMGWRMPWARGRDAGQQPALAAVAMGHGARDRWWIASSADGRSRVCGQGVTEDPRHLRFIGPDLGGSAGSGRQFSRSFVAFGSRFAAGGGILNTRGRSRPATVASQFDMSPPSALDVLPASRPTYDAPRTHDGALARSLSNPHRYGNSQRTMPSGQGPPIVPSENAVQSPIVHVDAFTAHRPWPHPSSFAESRTDRAPVSTPARPGHPRRPSTLPLPPPAESESARPLTA